jgi:hypothetical protein
MKPRDFASHLVFMRAYQFIQLIDCDTFRMLTHQAEDRLNGTILLGEFATISHDFSFSPPFYLALPGRVIQGLELSTELSDTTACARSATMRTARLAEPGKPVLQLLGPPANNDPQTGMVFFPIFPDAQTRSFSNPSNVKRVMIVRVPAASILSQSVIFSQEACKGGSDFPDTVSGVIFCAAIILPEHRLAFCY